MRGRLLITHTHWDHIQGFPFFAPLFVAGSEWDVYAPRQMGRADPGDPGQADAPDVLPGAARRAGGDDPLSRADQGEAFDLAGVRVTARYLNHPAPAIGYRLDWRRHRGVCDRSRAPSRHHPGAAGEPARVHREDERHIEFLAGADLVIHDAHYTLEEYPARLSWGHTPAEWAVDFAGAARATRLALFHHDPSRTDAPSTRCWPAAARVLRPRDGGVRRHRGP